jgi:hypothetical protein
MATTARGAEPAPLKWKSRASVSAPPSRTPARLQLTTAESAEPENESLPRMLFDPAVSQTVAVQAQALSDPLNDPFGDKNKPKTPPNIGSSTQPPLPSTVVPMPSGSSGPATLPAIPPGDQLAIGGSFKQEPCPKVEEFKKINAITNRIAAPSGDVPNECIIDERTLDPANRNWERTVYTWKASGMCHKPLYFEEEALERYGHSTGPFTQPFVSAAHFFGSVPLLPYMMGMDPPNECKYALGYYRPGSCAPYVIPGFPISARGMAAEAAAAAGLVYILP